MPFANKWCYFKWHFSAHSSQHSFAAPSKKSSAYASIGVNHSLLLAIRFIRASIKRSSSSSFSTFLRSNECRWLRWIMSTRTYQATLKIDILKFRLLFLHRTEFRELRYMNYLFFFVSSFRVVIVFQFFSSCFRHVHLTNQGLPRGMFSRIGHVNCNLITPHRMFSFILRQNSVGAGVSLSVGEQHIAFWKTFNGLPYKTSFDISRIWGDIAV